MKTINSADIRSGQKVIIRSSLNVTLDDNNQIIDDLRLRRTLETVQKAIDGGATALLMSHLSISNNDTLSAVVEWFRSRGFAAELVTDYYPYNPAKDSFAPGTVYVFQNVRQYDEEKANDPDFAADLAKYGDIYVNESFDSAHRAHASIVGIPRHLPSYAGINFTAEVANLLKVFTPDRPFVFVIGGAKIATKAPLIRKLLDKADKVFVAGALMNPLLHVRGFSVGQSLMPTDDIDVTDIANHANLELPVDFVDQNKQIITLDEIKSDTTLLDIGPESTRAIELLIEESRLVVWNGPLGNYEIGYTNSTNQLAQKLAASDCYSIIGGGDTLAAVDDQVEQGIDWISTGGGAMLDFIESEGDLPAIRALNQS